jgi:hypothetical protein
MMCRGSIRESPTFSGGPPLPGIMVRVLKRGLDNLPIPGRGLSKQTRIGYFLQQMSLTTDTQLTRPFPNLEVSYAR